MAPFLGVWPIITAGGARAHNGGGAAFVLIRDLKSPGPSSLQWILRY